MTNTQTCLLCRRSVLTTLPESTSTSVFLACSQCGRHYTLHATGSLTFRWGHPISLALYPVLFEPAPLTRVGDVSERWVGASPGPALHRAIDEIQRELDAPTQAVRDILDSPASEDLCREYLTSLVGAMRARLGQP